MSSNAFVFMPAMSAAMSTPCCSPIRPPMPFSVKPNASWIGGNWP